MRLTSSAVSLLILESSAELARLCAPFRRRLREPSPISLPHMSPHTYKRDYGGRLRICKDGSVCERPKPTVGYWTIVDALGYRFGGRPLRHRVHQYRSVIDTSSTSNPLPNRRCRGCGPDDRP